MAIRVESHPTRPVYSAQEHSHPYDDLLFVVTGKGYCVIEGHEYHLEPRMALFLPAGTTHSLVDKARSSMTVFVVSFDEATAQQQDRLLETLRHQVTPRHLPVHVWQTLRLSLRQMLHEQNLRPPHYDLAMVSLLSSVLLQLVRAYGSGGPEAHEDRERSEQRVRWVLEHIAHTYYQNHQLPEAAKMAGLSQRRFSTLCNQICGRSFVTYLNSIRIEHARRMLETSSLSVAAVAFQVGFEELSTFYRAFRKHVGCSPRQLGKNFN